MQLSVIILNYKVPYHLLLCLESVQKSLIDLPAEIIVVDNNSQDESCDLVRQHFPAVKLIANPNNDGFSKGNNIGIAEAKGKYICLLNPDTVVGENTFKNLLKFAEQHPDFGAIGPKLIDGRGSFLPESKRNIPSPKIALKKLLNNSKGYYSGLPENQNGKIEILAGAFMLMRKDRYLQVGGLDEDYFMYGEDIDLSYKFLKAGYFNYYVGSETVLHYKGESTAKDKVYQKRFYDAMMIFYQKHFERDKFSRHIVNFGLKLARSTHKIRSRKQPSTPKKINHICVDKQKELALKLEEVYQNKFRIIHPDRVSSNEIYSTLVVFNAAAINYKHILSLMENLGKQENSLKIKPAGFDIIIGSDHADVQGEIIHL
ncbi:MAG TPA: glycosyltransferase family 2 protein [Flavobacteriaceae bacterium]|nr:glycosyltransferase family 2 protein [Flavobacteriaceae bacterium]